MSKGAFEKFITPKVSGAKKKEAIKQEKKKAKAEVRAKGEEERKRNEVKYGLVTRDSKERESKNKIQDTKDKGFRNKEQDSRYKKQDLRGRQQDSNFTGINKEKK